MNANPFVDVFSVVGNAIRQEGFFSMWRGMGPTLLRDVPFSGECVKQSPFYCFPIGGFLISQLNLNISYLRVCSAAFLVRPFAFNCFLLFYDQDIELI